MEAELCGSITATQLLSPLSAQLVLFLQRSHTGLPFRQQGRPSAEVTPTERSESCLALGASVDVGGRCWRRAASAHPLLQLAGTKMQLQQGRP